jgi:hypothetical protein
MAPSVELWQPEAKHMGNVVERMIARDYLTETRQWAPLPSGPVTATVGDFFDVGNLQDYKQCLRNRHPLEVDRRELDRRNDFKIPDISTWQGEFRERVLGVSIISKDGARNEHYEIKPDNDDNTKKGKVKLDRITQDCRDLKLTAGRLGNGYARGSWYPPEARPGYAKGQNRRVRFTEK